MLSCVLILPENQRAVGNTVGEAMGWGPNNYSVPLALSGTIITHYGLHAWTEDSFKDLVESGAYMPELAEAGISEAQYQQMLEDLIYSFRVDVDGHFNDVLAANNLNMME
jgi:hypothetical protein